LNTIQNNGKQTFETTQPLSISELLLPPLSADNIGGAASIGTELCNGTTAWLGYMEVIWTELEKVLLEH
jgi:hypothetical protein